MVKDTIDRDPKYVFIIQMFKAFCYGCSNLRMTQNDPHIQKKSQTSKTRVKKNKKLQPLMRWWSHWHIELLATIEADEGAAGEMADRLLQGVVDLSGCW